MHYFTILCAFNFLAFAIVLLVKKSPIKRANSLMGIIFLLMAIYDIIVSYLHYAHAIHSAKLLQYYIPIDYVINIFFGPMIYWYLEQLLQKQRSLFSIKNWIPALSVIPAIIYCIYFITLPQNERVNILIGSRIEAPWQMASLNLLFYVQMVSHLVICYKTVRKQLAIGKYVIIRGQKISITWLRPYFIINLSVMLASAPVCFIVNNEYINSFIAQVAINVQFFYVFFNAIWQTSVFNEKTDTPQPTPAPIELKPIDTETDNDNAITLTDDVAQQYIATLIASMDKHKIYLQQGCSLNQVAELCNIAPHHLSHVINTHLNKNFFDFINEYRIAEAKSIFNDPQQSSITIEAIGYRCGFGSKTSFNKAFKKFTDKTPSEYRTSIQ